MDKYMSPNDEYYNNDNNSKGLIPSKLQLTLYYPSSMQPVRKVWCRGKCIAKIFKAGLMVVLLVTLMINISFIIETNRKLQEATNRNKAAGMSSLDTVADKSSDHIDMRQIKQIDSPPITGQQSNVTMPTLEIQAYSSKGKVFVMVNGAVIHENSEKDIKRGVHVVVLHQTTGSVMARRSFDTYTPNEDEALTLFLSMVSAGRIIIFAVKDEGSFHLKTACRVMLQSLGSEKSEELGWRDMWAMITIKGGSKLGELYSKSLDLSSWGEPVLLKANLQLRSFKDGECKWVESEENERRKKFCNSYEGYGSLCNCHDPVPLTFYTQSIEDNHITNIPVSIIASNRPHYLYRMLRSLLSAHGVNIAMVTVFIDGYFEEPLEVASLFGVRGIQHTPLGEKNARISQHYKATLTATFNIYPNANYAIFLEEDLDVSPDFFSYFSQAVPLMEQDGSLYCISAWNDQGYDHSCKDPSLLYRVETMPGLGWLVRRSLYKEELEANWPTPEKQWDWDMWMRLEEIRKGRECIVPDVSRTYHFGTSGVNMNSYFQEMYFKQHTLNTLPHVKLKNVNSLAKDQYEIYLHSLVQSAKLLDHTGDPCQEEYVPQINDLTFVLYIKMQHKTDHTTWKQLAKCLHLWDLDVRGVHKHMWRFFLNGNHILVIGSPISPYAKYKPADVLPISMREKVN